MARPPSATYKPPPDSPWPTPLQAVSVRHGLIGTTITNTLTLQSITGQELKLARRWGSFVLYLFPGSTSSPTHGADTPRTDAEEHRSFRDLNKRIAAQNATVVGISSQPVSKLQEAMASYRLRQPLVSDPTFRVGGLLKLPTFQIGTERHYERLTILITAGRITWVFYPVLAPSEHADEVLTHITGRRD
jgi:peroxiredoxin